eukprot:CAMPEP_0184240076 /NCGR_PEP_ID=MMETSP0976-20121227/27710_1 /TAXON_ID=483370 /ORGANISM="non described non described, Strain CCMP2097" /LENGTH=70 /DNA_ID=CAMNT_0026545303 /DNA_START=16 /DNA_END=225 /DNA_ORIENTATION=+
MASTRDTCGRAAGNASAGMSATTRRSELARSCVRWSARAAGVTARLTFATCVRAQASWGASGHLRQTSAS